MASEPNECPHMNFDASVQVARLEDSGGFVADLQIRCRDCELPFHFRGVPMGFSFKQPRAQVDGGTIHLPIAPGVELGISEVDLDGT